MVSWRLDNVTVIRNNTLGIRPRGLSIDQNNTIYLTDAQNHRVLIFDEGQILPTRNISLGLTAPAGIFVTKEGNIYVGDGLTNGAVKQYLSNSTLMNTLVMFTNSTCSSLFVDSNETLYCSLTVEHRIERISLTSSGANSSLTIAGNGLCALTPQALCFPQGLFIDSNGDLYVADTANDRIQRFRSGQSNGTTIVGNGSSLALTLRQPTSVTIDGSNAMYILDNNRQRILRSTSNEYRCIIGCTTPSRITFLDLTFDRQGNLFGYNEQEGALYKLVLSRNSCSK